MVMERAGYDGTDSAWAHSWPTGGERVKRPKRGTPLTREGGGHLAIFSTKTGTRGGCSEAIRSTSSTFQGMSERGCLPGFERSGVMA